MDTVHQEYWVASHRSMTSGSAGERTFFFEGYSSLSKNPLPNSRRLIPPVFQ
jgi:hypothetical protein